VNSRYALESRRSKDVDFNKLKGRYRPRAAVRANRFRCDQGNKQDERLFNEVDFGK